MEVTSLDTDLPLAKGCYLTFDVASHGTLFVNWALEEKGLATRVGYFNPQKPVPAFKYAGSGKSELIRGFQGSVNRFYLGFCQFVKLGKDYDAEICITTDVVHVFVRKSNGEILQLNENEFVALKDCTAVVCLAAANDTLTAGLSMMQEQFLRIGQNEGASLALVLS